ncbi:DUF6338 family protein [Saccharopolyspora gloriosae]|uniref:Uncharacterized protein n=1 Tax=Saccharopolyspora gloriosae TaxID=455344 RepID=A0A840NNZ8_9PSEU|nr:hypothetical protein [Saccharopolyspora gloriosae]
MKTVPSSLLQVAFIVLIVLPGVTYQFLRERWRGPVPAEQNFGQRVLRAITASLVLDAFYVIIAGPQLLFLVRGNLPTGFDGLTQNIRTVGVTAMLLFTVIPAIAAGAVSWWERRRLGATFRGVPTAWDHTFRDRGPCFVRARLANGSWIGGWYGTRSYATSYPHAGEIFLQSAWQMDQNGRFMRKTNDSAGVFFRIDDIEILELLDPPSHPDMHKETDCEQEAAANA